MVIVHDTKTGLPLEQASDSWLDYRKGKLGATQFSTYAVTSGLVNSKYDSGTFESIYQILDEEYNPKPYKKFKSSTFKVGNALESVIRLSIDKLTVPAVLESDWNPRVYSSYDGINLIDMTIDEIKTTKHFDDFDETLKGYLFQFAHEYFVLNGNNVKDDMVAGYIHVLDKQHYRIFNFKDCYKEYKILFNGNKFFSNEIFVDIDYDMWKLMCEGYLDLYDHIKLLHFETLPRDRELKSKFISEFSNKKNELTKEQIDMAKLIASMPRDFSTGNLYNLFIKEINK